MYPLNPLLEAKPIKFSTGSLSANFDHLRKIKQPWSRFSFDKQNQLDRIARKKAADAIRKFNGRPDLKKREWVRQLRIVNSKIHKNLKAHGG